MSFECERVPQSQFFDSLESDSQPEESLPESIHVLYSFLPRLLKGVLPRCPFLGVCPGLPMSRYFL